MDKAIYIFNKLSATHQKKMYRGLKEYIKKRISDEPKLIPTEYQIPSTHLEKNAGRPYVIPSLLKRRYKFNTKAFKRVLKGEQIKNTARQFVAGGIGGNVATAITYPMDTKQIREQTGLGPPKSLGDLYKGVGAKLKKNFLHTGIQMGTIAATLGAVSKIGLKK